MMSSVFLKVVSVMWVSICFRVLTKQFPDLASLRSLLAGLVVPRQQHDASTVIGSSESADDTPPQPLRPASPWLPSQLAPFLKKLSSKDSGGE